jgi:hypothetical protein
VSDSKSWFSISKGRRYEDTDPETRVTVEVVLDGVADYKTFCAELDRLVAEVKRVY